MFIPAFLSFPSISTLLVFGPGGRDASEGSTPKRRNFVPIVQMIAVWGLVNFWLADRVWSDDLCTTTCLAQILSVLGGLETWREAREPLQA